MAARTRYPKKPCPEGCGKRYAPQGLPGHLKSAHGITVTPKRPSKPKRPAKTPAKPAGPTFTAVPFVVLQDDQGGVWLAERIR